MSGRASEFTASNPWQDPETRLPSGEFSGTDVLKGLTEILSRWPSDPVVTRDEDDRHTILMKAIAGYPDVSAGTRPLDRPLHPESSHALRVSLWIDSIPGMHRQTSLRSSILNRDMSRRFDVYRQPHDDDSLIETHKECLLLLFARLRQYDGFDLNDYNYRLEEENLLATLHSYDNNRIHSNQELSWPKLSGGSGLSSYSDIIEDIGIKEEFLVPPDCTIATFEYGFIQNWLRQVMPDSNVKLVGTRQRLWRGASTLIEARCSEIRSILQDRYGPGCILIDGGGRLTCILPNSSQARLSSNMEESLRKLKIGIQKEYDRIEEASTPGTEEFGKNTPEKVLVDKAQLHYHEEVYKEQHREYSTNLKRISDLKKTQRRYEELSTQISECHEKMRELIDSNSSSSPGYERLRWKVVSLLTALDHLQPNQSNNLIDQFRMTSFNSGFDFLNANLATGGADKRFNHALSSTWEVQGVEEVMMHHTGQKSLGGRFAHFFERLHHWWINRKSSDSNSNDVSFDEEFWYRIINANLPPFRISSRNLSETQSLTNLAPTEWLDKSIFDYDPYRSRDVKTDFFIRYPCCICNSMSDLDYNSIDRMINSPTSAKYGFCVFHRLLYLIGTHQRLVDSTLHPRDNTIDPTPRAQRSVESVVKIDANSLGIVFTERTPDLEPIEEADRIRRRSFRFNAKWWNILSKSVAEVSSGDQIGCWIAAGDDVMFAEYKSQQPNSELTENLIEKLLAKLSKELSELNAEVTNETEEAKFFISFSAGISKRGEGIGIEEMLERAEYVLSTAKDHWRLAIAENHANMITLADGSMKLPGLPGGFQYGFDTDSKSNKINSCPPLKGDIWMKNSLIRSDQNVPVDDPGTDEYDEFQMKDWHGLWSAPLIQEICNHFQLGEPNTKFERIQLNRILARHYVKSTTLVVLPPKSNDAYMLRRNFPPVSNNA